MPSSESMHILGTTTLVLPGPKEKGYAKINTRTLQNKHTHTHQLLITLVSILFHEYLYLSLTHTHAHIKHQLIRVILTSVELSKKFRSQLITNLLLHR